MIVSCEASYNFDRRSYQNDRFVQSFQNDRFVRGFLKISQKKVPKRAFRARLPQIFRDQCFQNRIAHNPRLMRGAIPRGQNLHFATVSCNRPPNPTRGFIQQNQNVRLATTACHPKFKNARFATAACTKMFESSQRRPRQPAAYKNHHFTTVSGVRPARSDERVARATSKFAFHHSFGRPMSRKRRKGCATTQRILHFTTVLDVRRPRSDERVASPTCKLRISPQFWESDDHEVTRWLRRGRDKFAFHHSFGRPTTTK